MFSIAYGVVQALKFQICWDWCSHMLSVASNTYTRPRLTAGQILVSALLQESWQIPAMRRAAGARLHPGGGCLGPIKGLRGRLGIRLGDLESAVGGQDPSWLGREASVRQCRPKRSNMSTRPNPVREIFLSPLSKFPVNQQWYSFWPDGCG